MVMTSEEGSPSLKVSFQIAHIPLDENIAEIGDHGNRETCRFLHPLQVEEEYEF